MDKAKLNFVIEALMFLCLTAMAGLGLLMKYVLLPGRERWAKYGRNVDLTWLGMDRHDWGAIHLYIAVVLLSLLTIHLILHWKMILRLFERLIADGKLRLKIGLAFVIIGVLLIYFPFLITPEVKERGRGAYRSETGITQDDLISRQDTKAPGFQGKCSAAAPGGVFGQYGGLSRNGGA